MDSIIENRREENGAVCLSRNYLEMNEIGREKLKQAADRLLGIWNKGNEECVENREIDLSEFGIRY